jgi:hypothetical protein
MKTLMISAATLGIALLSTGCGPAHKSWAPWSYPGDQAKVTVRFVAPPEDTRVAEWTVQRSAKLVSDPAPCNRNAGGFATEDADGDPGSQHVVLWGGQFEGEDVSQGAAELASGSYMFGYFDPDRGAAYQGWIAVNNGGDDVLSALHQWRDSVHEQEEWLAYESKITGKYSSRDPNDFNQFAKQLKSLRQLGAKIEAAIHAETNDRARMNSEWNQTLGEAEVQLMPGPSHFPQRTTLAAFQDSELSTAKRGQAVTKVVFAGDFARSMEKMDRLAELREEMYRCRSVFGEEVKRLQNRRDYYRITSHLYDHGVQFVENERKMQRVRGLVAQIDKQLTENRRRGHALMFVAGLFSPDEADAAFDREQSALHRDRIVLAEQQRQLDARFNNTSPDNERRVSLERQRQDLMAQIEDIDTQLGQVGKARFAVAKLRGSTGIIHRKGPATVLATSLMDDQLPARLADAIERESMMTIRLQAAEGLGGQSADAEFAPSEAVNKQWNRQTKVTSEGPVPAGEHRNCDHREAQGGSLTANEAGIDDRTPNNPPQVRLTNYRDSGTPSEPEQPEKQQKAEENKPCPWFIKLLVPPCWIEELRHKGE